MNSEEVNVYKSLEEENDGNLLNIKPVNQETAEISNVKHVNSSSKSCSVLLNNVERNELNVSTEKQNDEYEIQEKQKSVILCSDLNKCEETMEYSAGHTSESTVINQQHTSLDNNDVNAEVESNNISLNKTKHSRRLVLDDDDDDDDVTTHEKNNKSITEEVEKKHVIRRLAIVDSDSDEELDVGLETLKQSKGSTLKSVASLPSVDNENLENDDHITQELHRKRLAALCDSEDSDEEVVPQVTPIRTKSKVPPKRKNVKKSTTEEPLGKRMTVKQAMKQRQEIRSESQRMLRESKISLPYHKPKTYSIKEFLQRRPRFCLSGLSTSNDNSISASAAIKMTNQQLDIVTKKLKEREKEVQKFYKSESESDNDDDMGATPPNSPSKSTEQIVESNEIETKNLHYVNKDDECNTEKLIAEIIHDVIENCFTQSKIYVADGDNSNEIIQGVASTSQDSSIEKIHIEPSLSLDNQFEELSDTCVPEQNQEKIQESITSTLYSTETEKSVDDKVKEFSSNTNCDSMDFDFTVDDDDDDEGDCNNDTVSKQNINDSLAKEKSAEDRYLDNLIKKYSTVEVCDDLTSSDQNCSNRKLNKQELLKQFESVKPCLSGGPDQDIDLDEGITKPNEVVRLMERFMQHALTKPVVKTKVQLDIINLSQGEIHRETVAMAVDPEEEPPVCEKPGERLQKLRNELQSQIAQRRSEMWQQKSLPVINNKDEDRENDDADEKSECGADDEYLLDDDEEAELTNSESSDECDEEEETKKDRVKSGFVDDEAEESEADGSDNNESEKDITDNKDEEQDEDYNDSSYKIKKPLKRIIKAFTEDSDEEDDDSNSQPFLQKVDNKNQDTNMWNDEDDEILPPNQPIIDKTPNKEITQKSKDLSFLTPIQRLTGLEGFNSESKFLQEESLVSPLSLLPDPSPLKDTNWNTNVQKSLFSNSCDFLDSQTNMEEAKLCSGKFPSSTEDIPSQALQFDNIESLATQDVLSICSGSFPDVTQDNSNFNNLNDDKRNKDVFQDEEKSIPRESIVQKEPSLEIDLNINNESQDLDDDKLISQLLDEEELELFKKKFESPIADTSNFASEINKDEVDEVVGGGRLVSDSSDDDTGTIEKKNKKRKKRPQKKLAFSDDESDSDCEEEQEEVIDLQDDCFDDEDDETTRVVDYDSEENEIEHEESNQQKKLHPGDFFEKEAELSESDWDSADEDEKGLDILETEQGDADVFDEKQIRTDLEKIHMRHILDDDNREIKILQELLLEDGELHGTGRQRQFRWRNVDDTMNDENAQQTEIDAYLDDEDNEQQWRQARHQREMYLRNKEEKREMLDESVEIDSNSQVLKLGHEVIRKSLSNTTIITEKTTASSSINKVAKSLMPVNTRGSFLARNDKFLTRLAEYTKINNVSTGITKNAKKIVFRTIDPDAEDANANKTSFMSNKRKADKNGTPTIIKKLRLSSNLTPDGKNENRRKQLFK